MKLTDVGYKNHSVMKSKTRFTIVDTGTSLSYFSLSDFVQLSNKWLADSSDVKCFTLTRFYCFSTTDTCSALAPKLGDVQVRIDDVIYNMPPESYLLPEINGVECLIGIFPIEDESGLYILGDNFIREFYSVFDYENNQVKLALHANARPGSVIKQGERLKGSLSTMEIIGIVAGSFIALVIVLWCVTKFCGKKDHHTPNVYSSN